MRQADELQILTFKVDNDTYGIDVSTITEIIRYTPITRVPRENKKILGIFMPRDEIVTAIDLRYCLSDCESEANEKDYFIICRVVDKLRAFQVSDVNEIKHVSRKDILQPNSVVNMKDSVITGLLHTDNDIVSIINIEKAC